MRNIPHDENHIRTLQEDVNAKIQNLLRTNIRVNTVSSGGQHSSSVIIRESEATASSSVFRRRREEEEEEGLIAYIYTCEGVHISVVCHHATTLDPLTIRTHRVTRH